MAVLVKHLYNYNLTSRNFREIDFVFVLKGKLQLTLKNIRSPFDTSTVTIPRYGYFDHRLLETEHKDRKITALSGDCELLRIPFKEYSTLIEQPTIG